MDEARIQDHVQQVSKELGFDVKEVSRPDDSTIFIEQDAITDETRALLLAAVLFDQLGFHFNTIALNEWGAEGATRQYERESVEEAMDQFVSIFNELED